MRADTAFFSLAVSGRRFLCGLTSGLLSAAAVFFREERRGAEAGTGADAPSICSTSVNALTARGRSLFAEPACSGSLAMSD